jgi:hypothetical protein
MILFVSTVSSNAYQNLKISKSYLFLYSTWRYVGGKDKIYQATGTSTNYFNFQVGKGELLLDEEQFRGQKT